MLLRNVTDNLVNGLIGHVKEMDNDAVTVEFSNVTAILKRIEFTR